MLYNVKNRRVHIDFILKPSTLNTISVWTDASQSFGAGGHTDNGSPYHLPWNLLKIRKTNIFKTSFRDHIIFLELFAVVLLAYMQAPKWKHKQIDFYCDNIAVVSALNKGTLKFTSKMYYPKANLIKFIACLAIKHQFYFTAHKIDGDHNIYADPLSRNNLPFNDILRQKIYNYFKCKENIPSKKASKLFDLTCLNKFNPKVY